MVGMRILVRVFLRSTGGKRTGGAVPLSFRITKGNVFFGDGGTVVRVTGWNPQRPKKVTVYFEGNEPPHFCIVPIIHKGGYRGGVHP